LGNFYFKEINKYINIFFLIKPYLYLDKLQEYNIITIERKNGLSIYTATGIYYYYYWWRGWLKLKQDKKKIYIQNI